MTAEFGSAAVSFVKASACGNDFLIIEGEQASGDLAEFTRRVCDRRKGVGADGVEWLYPAKDCGCGSSTHQRGWFARGDIGERNSVCRGVHGLTAQQGKICDSYGCGVENMQSNRRTAGMCTNLKRAWVFRWWKKNSRLF